MKFKPIGSLPKTAVIKRINPHLLKLLTFEEKHDIFMISPEGLLTPNRFDVIAKYIYGKQREQKTAVQWATGLYKEHLKVWGGFVEGDGSGKDTFEKYLASFNDILDSIKRQFNEKISIIPLDKNMEIIDGGHRSAACMVYERPCIGVKFDYDAPSYDYTYFRSHGLSQDYMDQMALEYCKLSTNSYIVCLFPVATGKPESLKRILLEYGRICYEKDILFRRYGPQNFARQLYRGEAWIGKPEDGLPGTIAHANNRFVPNRPVTIYVFETDSLAKIKEAKSRIRSLFNLENDSVHINDSYEETVRLAEQLFNNNSIYFLNNSNAAASKTFAECFQHFKNEIEMKGYDKDEFCIDGSSVMAAFGIRDANDLDYLHCGRGTPSFDFPKISCHNNELMFHQNTLEELVFNRTNYFYYDGIKFVNLENLAKMKRIRGEDKDRKDIYLINCFLGRAKASEKISHQAFELLEKSSDAMGDYLTKAASRLGDAMPSSLMSIARKGWRLVRASKNVMTTIRDRWCPDKKRLKYRNCDLFYSRGTSVIEIIKNGNMYEPEVTRALYAELVKSKQQAMLDIGANIGLITLNVLSLLPEIKVFAFEPGKHQAMLFKKTIAHNGLQKRVELTEVALSNKTEKAPFAVHDSKDASGDGFFDTGRAGKTTTVMIDTVMLDQWWYKRNMPVVKVVKIDTEGAELFVLQGGQNFVAYCSPSIIFEMHEDNLKPYPYEAYDILDWFWNRDYMVKTLGGIEVRPDNVAELMNSVQDYIASPINRKL